MNAERANEEIRQKHISEKNASFSYGCDLYSDFYASFMEQQNQQCKWNSSVPGTFLVPYIFCTQELQQLCAGMQTKGGRKIYKSANVFLIRQFSSKIRTMQFTMGTLTVLFTVALLVSSIALMFMDYQINMMEQANPFDIFAVQSGNRGQTFIGRKAEASGGFWRN